MKENRKTKRLFAVSALLLLVLSALSLTTGSYSLSLGEILTAPDSTAAKVFFGLRIPRTVCAILGGGVLGLTGAVYQTVFGSPLASPDVTGVSSGASLGAALAIVLGTGSAASRMGLSFAFGLLSLAAVLAVVKAARLERTGAFLLAGILVSSLGQAGLMLLKTFADPERELAALEFWTMGSLASVKADKALLLSAICGPASVLLLLLHRAAASLALGEDEARSAGLSPNRWRAILLGLSTLAVSAVVSAAGVIGFVGLTAPPVIRLLHPSPDGAFFGLSFLAGAILLTAADVLARLLSPFAELPLSIFTVLFAVPVLLTLLIGKGGVSHA